MPPKEGARLPVRYALDGEEPGCLSNRMARHTLVKPGACGPACLVSLQQFVDPIGGALFTRGAPF